MFGRFSVLDFFTENGTNFGRELQGQPLGSSNPGTGEGNTYNVSAGAHLHAVVDARDGRARRLRAHEHRRRAVGHRREQGAGRAGPARAPTARTPTKAARRCSTSTPMRISARPTRSCRTTAATISIRRCERQLDQGRPQHPVRHRHLLPGAQPHAARDQRRRQLRRARRIPVPVGSDADPGRARRQPVQRVRVVPARRAEPDRPAEAGRAVHDAQLAVQPLRPRPVAGLVEDDRLVRHALGVLPGAHARPPRARAVQRRHQPDDDRRHRQRAEGSGRRASARRCSRRASA